MHKYEIIVEGKTTNQDMVLSVKEIEKAAKQINTKKAGDRKELKDILFTQIQIYIVI